MITTEQARQAARDVLARVRFGEDAPHDRAGRRASALVSDLIDEFMRDEVRPTLKRSAFAKPRGQPSSYDVGGGLEAETVGIPWIIDRSSPKAKRVQQRPAHVVSPFATAALRLLLLTGCRLRKQPQVAEPCPGPDGIPGPLEVVAGPAAIAAGDYVVAGARDRLEHGVSPS